MLILIMGIAHAKAFVLDLTTPAASQRHKRRIAPYPLLTTRGFHSRRLGIATEPAMLAGNRRGFHAVVSHGGCLLWGWLRHASRSLEGCITPPIALSYAIIFISIHPPPTEAMGLSGARVMSQLSNVTHSRHQWTHKATQRGDHDRYQRTQHARISAERDRVTTALKAAQARLQQLEAQLRQLEAQLHRPVARPKVDLVLLALQLFLVARIGFRAVSRVLS